jgi:RNA polymerase sigma-32 factor
MSETNLVLDRTRRRESHSSALSAYLAKVDSVAKSSALSRADEERLAREFRGTKDPSTLRVLVMAHLRTVVDVVRPLVSIHASFLDLIQEGNVALIHAVRRYNPDRAVTLRAYASSWIRTYAERFLQSQPDFAEA